MGHGDCRVSNGFEKWDTRRSKPDISSPYFALLPSSYLRPDCVFHYLAPNAKCLLTTNTVVRRRNDINIGYETFKYETSPPRNVFTSLTPSVVHLDRYCQVSFDSRTDKGNCPVRREKSATRHHKSRTIFSLSLHTFALRPSTIPFHATSAFPMDEPDVRDRPVRNGCTTEAQVSVIAVSSANYAWFLRVPWEGAIAQWQTDSS